MRLILFLMPGLHLFIERQHEPGDQALEGPGLEVELHGAVGIGGDKLRSLRIQVLHFQSAPFDLLGGLLDLLQDRNSTGVFVAIAMLLLLLSISSAFCLASFLHSMLGTVVQIQLLHLPACDEVLNPRLTYGTDIFGPLDQPGFPVRRRD